MPLAPCALLAIFAAGCGRPDSEVASSIKQLLANDPATASLDISVVVRRGVAYLSGETTTCAEQERAIELARKVEGVSDVENHLQIKDELLAAAVKKALSAEPLLTEVPIDVDSRNGHIRLMSDRTDREHRERAVAVARNLCGVREVEDRMK